MSEAFPKGWVGVLPAALVSFSSVKLRQSFDQLGASHKRRRQLSFASSFVHGGQILDQQPCWLCSFIQSACEEPRDNRAIQMPSNGFIKGQLLPPKTGM